MCSFVHPVACASPLLGLYLCVPSPTFVRTCVYMSCLAYGMDVYLPERLLCFPANTSMRVHTWASCWARCATLFSGLPPPPLEPQIVLHPYDIWNVTGQDVIFGCEVFAYPMASIEWRKDGLDIQLPGDDPHISVQVG